MSSRLSKKEKGFVQAIAKGKTGTQAVLENYDTKSENVAASIASENLRKPKIIQAVKSIADCIPDKLLVKKHLELLNKQEVITKNNVTTGEVDVIPTGEIDAQAVKAGLDMAYKIKGSYAPEEKSVTIREERILMLIQTNQAILAQSNGGN